MSQQLERILPILAAIPGAAAIVAPFQSVYIAASQRKIEQFEQALRSEVGLLNQKLEAHNLRLDHGYVKSEAFSANVMQALRAAELAETETKLRFIARALAGCALSFPPPSLDRFQTMRIIEGLSDRELKVFVEYFQILDPIDPYQAFIPTDNNVSIPGLTRQEFVSAFLGLQQLGLLSKDQMTDRDGEWRDTPHQGGTQSGFAWKLTALARQVATLSRVGPKEA